MSAVSWVGFSISSTVTKTLLHFFPSAEGVGAPYPVECTISIAGGAQPRRSISLDGARLGNPDGVRIEDAFPSLGQQISGLYAIHIQLSTAQPRVELGASSCVLELSYQHSMVRYWPRRVATLDEGKPKSQQLAGGRGILNPFANFGTAIITRDPLLQGSILLINGAAQPISAVLSAGQGDDAIIERINLTPESSKEIDNFEKFSSRATKSDVTWGAIESLPVKVMYEEQLSLANVSTPSAESATVGSPLTVSAPTPAAQALPLRTLSLGAAAAAFLVYRDRSSRRIVSALAL